ncbi:tRNA (N6-threonylcarbamoyladenosine(37)-N6)-methyltransferase TrmO [Cytophagales bacterium WSM2-2]|nr:tRNA (N6-threonylcarbamoyladenosine(37)-N6)-methyltransferase TrmO [Cytophagales bacterium WSM2-2]
MEIKLNPIGIIRNSRTEPTDDFWGEVISEIQLADHIPAESLTGINAFSHLEVVYYFDKANDGDVVYAGRPRGNPDYPLVGIFSQRKKDRPNKIGLSIVELVEHTGKTLKVKFLDAIDGTPVLDIKPVFREFLPQKSVKQPNWVKDLMKKYWI